MVILALSPHTDDVELCAGGTVARFVAEGMSICVAAFGTGDAGSGANSDEYTAAMRILGVTDFRLLDQFPACHYPDHRQAILAQLEVLRNEIHPDLVLCPSVNDNHQDHATVTRETVRAFKYYASILAYEAPWNFVAEPFRPSYFVKLEQWHLDAKMDALECYVSQSERAYWDMDFIRGQALVHGMRVQVRYAEAFEVVRWIR